MNAARSTVALVLAGGRGERLRQLTDWRAKPAVPFGGKFRIIDFTLSNCVNSGIRRIGICTQYKAQSLIRHVQRGWSFLDGRFDEFVELLPAQQRDDRRLVPAARRTRSTRTSTSCAATIRSIVLVLAGDHVYKMDYARDARRARRARRRITVGLRRGAARARRVQLRRDAASTSDGRVTRVRGKAGAAARRCPGRPDAALAQHGHLRVQRGVPLRAAARATRATASPATISARTSSRAW